MSDPAVEAAYRAWPHMDKVSDRLMIAAAREALRPIRELHYVAVVDWDDHRVCATCWGPNGPADWPCATALLVYTSADLECSDGC